MRKTLSIFIVALFGCSSIWAQPNTPAKTTSSQSNTQSQEAARFVSHEREKRIEEKRLTREKAAFEKFQSFEYGWRRRRRSTMAFRTRIEPIYRKPSKKDLKALSPDERDMKKYAGFLKQRNTGIFRLVPDIGCSESTKVLDVSPDCSQHKIPGAGSSYSFRVRNYRISRLGDMTYIRNSLVSKGSLVGAIFVGLGDVPLEKVSLKSPGLLLITRFTPSNNSSEAFKTAHIFAQDVKQNGFIYGRVVYAAENMTFVLRSTAYRGKQLKALAGVTYNELDFDKRRDIIVAFRIVRKDKNESITILWKELRNKKSPKLFIPKK